MPDLQGRVSYPGVTQVLSASYTLSWGVSPGTVTLTIPPQDVGQIEGTGDLTLSDSVNPPITLKQCQVVDAAYSSSLQGQTLTLQLYDRRWRWDFEEISGRYNQLQEITQTVPPVQRLDLGQPLGNPMQPPPPDPHGEEPIKPWTRKTLPELAKLCLEAMQETGYDISALDPLEVPTVQWDRERPAVALQRLCNDHGCVVVYRPDTDSVLIAKQGEGQPLPGGQALAFAPSLKARPRPAKLVCCGMESVYQLRFSLRPVCKDFDGAFKILAKLSFRPKDDDWTKVNPIDMSGLAREPDLPGKYTNKDARHLAASWLYRAYQITLTDADGKNALSVPPDSSDPDDQIDRIEQIVLLNHKALVTRDDLGRLSQAPAACYGRHTLPNWAILGKNVQKDFDSTNLDTPVKVPFSIDATHQLITFSKYVYALKADGKFYPAEITLETGCHVLDADTFAPRRFRRERQLAGTDGTGEVVFIRDEVRWQKVAIYGENNNKVSKSELNETECKRRADFYLDGEQRKYELAAAADVTWPGFVSVFADGLTMQVTWQFGGGTIQTRASQNTEHALYIPSYMGRRKQEEISLDENRNRARWDRDLSTPPEGAA